LQSLIEEFNSLNDLTVKYNSQLKVCKIIEANEDYAYGLMAKKQGQQVNIQVPSVKVLMNDCLKLLQELSKSKDKEIEDYLEEFAEEKVMAQLDLKTKYSRMLNMLKGKPDAEEKTKQIEEKKKVEEQ
jgi:hypothetical protein